jgi:hypothetical protein
MYALILYLLGVLTAVSRKNNNREHSNAETHKDKGYCLPDSPISVVSFPPPKTDQEQAEDKKKKIRKSVKFWVEIWAL